LTKDELWQMAWEGISEGVQMRKSPYRTFTLATAEPDTRIVVLRSAEPEAWIQFHTDARSSKVSVLERDARCAALFYDPSEQIQVRLRCRAEVRRGDEAAWEATAILARRCYLASQGPGSPIPEPEAWIEPELMGRAPSQDEAEPGRANFSAIRLHVESAEVLKLGYEAHRRAAFSLTADGWQGQWLSP
jgi:pyridoxine/pyridoxamine 5'-phosphate oxidase